MATFDDDYQFGDFLVRPDSNVIVKAGIGEQVSPRVMDVLMYLIVNRDRVVHADELLDKLWIGRVVEESTIHRHINQLRSALGDSARDPKYIKTVSKRGYQAIATVSRVMPPHAAMEEVASVLEDEPLRSHQRRIVRGWSALLGIVAILVLTVAAALFLRDTTAPRVKASFAPGPGSLSSVAVLPFSDLSDLASARFFGEGLADIVLDRLARSNLKVASRTDTFQLAAENFEIGELAGRLKVAYVLEGSIQSDQRNVRISAQLIRVSDGFHVWSKTYDRAFDEFLRVQSEVGDNIAQMTLAELLADIRRQHPELFDEFRGINPKAVRYYLDSEEQYDLYLRGEGGDVRHSMRLMEMAARVDPQFIAAQEQLAWNYTYRVDPSLTIEEASAGAHRAIERSLAVNPDSPDALFFLAQIFIQLDLDYASAEDTIKRGLELMPNGRWWPVFLANIAFREGRDDEAMRLLRMAYTFDFTSEKAVFLSLYAWNLLNTGENERALAVSDEILPLVDGGEPRTEALLIRTSALIALQRMDEARSVIDEAWLLGGTHKPEAFAAAYVALGETEKAETILSRARMAPRNRGFFAAGYVALGKYDKFFDTVRAGILDHDPSVIGKLPLYAGLEQVRSDPRFGELVALLESKETRTARYLESKRDMLRAR